MKKIIIAIVILLVVVSVGIFAVSRSNVQEKGEIVYNQYSLTVEKNSSGYLLTLTAEDDASGVVSYDGAGMMIASTNVEPLNADAVSVQILEDVHTHAEMLQAFGEPMADIGFGMYIPAYVTEDGRILSFTLIGEEIENYSILSVAEM